MAGQSEAAQRILIYTPYGKDSQHLCKVLSAEQLDCLPCASIPELVGEISPAVLAILTTEEVFFSDKLPLMVAALKHQPTWSAIPVLVFYSPREGVEVFHPQIAEPFHEIADITFLPRPVSSLVLRSAVHGAVRDRQRQYRTRDLLVRLQQDIQRRESQEQELKRAHAAAEDARQAAELANTSKSQFLANMSHEIRTPLGAIMGFADLIAQPETTRDETETYISVIRRNSNQLLRIIDDILDLSKVESGRMAFENIEFSLGELLTDFNSMMGLRARENGIELLTHEGPNLPQAIVSDPTRLKQILMNVVGNAIKFTRQGQIDFTVAYADGMLSFEVQDTGRGISEEQRESLFQAFIQADASTTRKFGGTGLGLILTRRLCRAMGGDFFLQESELGKGSTFVARVRVQPVLVENQAAAPHAPDENLEPQPLLGTDILLVEDSPDNQALICISLTRAGATVDIASDGMQGVEMALDGRYSVVLMDAQMPRMDGIEAVRTLRDRGFAAPIVALTAHAMKEEAERCIAAGFSSFLSKPVHKDRLVDLVRELVT